jgi:putative PIN family toxin of toxin-antitoxin system
VLLLRSEIVIPLDCNEPELRDSKDLKVLGTLLASQADYLVTGDKDLLALSHKYPILTPAAFWQRRGS